MDRNITPSMMKKCITIYQDIVVCNHESFRHAKIQGKPRRVCMAENCGCDGFTKISKEKTIVYEHGLDFFNIRDKD